MTTKLYCYVDETGQDTQGRQFIVGMVFIDDSRDELSETCKRIEVDTGKRNKWSDTPDAVNVAYMRGMIALLASAEILQYAVYEGIYDYIGCAVDAIACAALAFGHPDTFTVNVMYDALQPSDEQKVAVALRGRGLRVSKVRGIRREQNEPLLRLADGVCGLVRDAHAGKVEHKALMQTGLSRRALVNAKAE